MGQVETVWTGTRRSPYWVEQVGLGQGGLQIRWDRIGLGQGGLQIRRDRMGWERSLLVLSLSQWDRFWYRQRDCTMCLYHMVPQKKSVLKIGPFCRKSVSQTCLLYQKSVSKIGLSCPKLDSKICFACQKSV